MGTCVSKLCQPQLLKFRVIIEENGKKDKQCNVCLNSAHYIYRRREKNVSTVKHLCKDHLENLILNQ